MSARAWFVAGTHTDVGKTHVACGLITAARARGFACEALKPVVSGFDPTDWTGSDPGRLLQALGRTQSPANLENISPWRFRAPLAPPMAARREGRTLQLASISEFCREALAPAGADLFLVEGVGGLMSPLADRATGLDLMADLGLPAILVSGAYLGAISHLLTALEVLRARSIDVGAVVISQCSDPDAPDFGETLDAVLAHASEVPVAAVPRDGDSAWADRLLTTLGF